MSDCCPHPFKGTQLGLLLKPHMLGLYGGLATQPGVLDDASIMKPSHLSPMENTSSVRSDLLKVWKFKFSLYEPLKAVVAYC